MSELSELLDAAEVIASRGEAMALATVVATRGSTYRRAGARLLIPAEGEPRVVEFDMTADEDAVWGYGLGCNGAIELLVEPTAAALESVGALRTGQGACLVMPLTGPDIGLHRLETDGAAAAALRDGRPRVEEVAGERVFYEPLLPPLRLLVCGAGHDAIPLVRQATELGWRVVVVDVRQALLTPERFGPGVDFANPDPEAAALALAPDAGTAAVLMSHNYLRDIAYLGSFLDRPLAYLGVLGPRGRTEQMLAEIGAPEAIERLHAPAGLDIGAEGAEEVAHSIIAEILAVIRGRAGRPLRDRSGSIHEPR